MATKIRLQRGGRKGYAFYSIVIADASLQHIKARHAGIYCRLVATGSRVTPGESLAHVIDPYNEDVCFP